MAKSRNKVSVGEPAEGSLTRDTHYSLILTHCELLLSLILDNEPYCLGRV
jgi:hypothetical protein